MRMTRAECYALRLRRDRESIRLRSEYNRRWRAAKQARVESRSLPTAPPEESEERPHR